MLPWETSVRRTGDVLGLSVACENISIVELIPSFSYTPLMSTQPGITSQIQPSVIEKLQSGPQSENVGT